MACLNAKLSRISSKASHLSPAQAPLAHVVAAKDNQASQNQAFKVSFSHLMFRILISMGHEIVSRLRHHHARLNQDPQKDVESNTPCAIHLGKHDSKK